METIIENIRQAFDSFDALHIAVLGDIMLDRFVRGEVERISPEAPVPVILKKSEECFPGGAANVSMNIVELGGRAYQYGVVGSDSAGATVRKMLTDRQIDTSNVLESKNIPTTLKTRFVSMGQQLLRVDEEIHLDNVEEKLKHAFELPDICHALLVSDYNKGVIPLFAESLVSKALQRGIPVIVDPKPPNWKYYKGCTVVTPNRKESLNAGSGDGFNTGSMENVAGAVMNTAGSKYVILTWGADGLYTWDGQSLDFVKSHRVQVFDSTGAGDSVIAALTLAIASGLDLKTSARIANAAGAVAVSRPGIARVNRNDIIKILFAEEDR